MSNMTLSYHKKSYQKTLKPSDLNKFPELNWDYDALFKKYIYPAHDKKERSITNWLKVFPYEKLDFRSLSNHLLISPKWLLLYPDANWDYKNIIESKILLYLAYDETLDLKKVDTWLDTIPAEKVEPLVEYFSQYNYLSLILLEKYPNLNWNFEIISSNSAAALDWIESFPDREWNYRKLIYNTFFNVNWLLKFPDKAWPWEEIILLPEDFTYFVYDNFKKHNLNLENFSQTPNLTLSWILKLPLDLEIFSHVSANKKVKYNWVLQNPQLPWDFQELSHHNFIDVTLLKKYQDKPWDFSILSFHRNLELSWIKLFPNAPWDFTGIEKSEMFNIYSSHLVDRFPNAIWNYPIISRHQNLDLELVMQFPEKSWDFVRLSRNKKLKFSFIQKFKDKKWSLAYLSKNPNLDITWISLFPIDKWNFTEISNNSKLNLSWLLAYPDQPWDFTKLSSSKHLKLEWLEKLPDKPWSGPELSFNPNFTNKWFERFPNLDWNYSYFFKQDTSIYFPLYVQNIKPDIPVATYLKFWNAKKIKPILLPLVIMNPKNQYYLDKYEIEGLDLWKDIELTTEDKNMIVEIYRQKIPISQLEPNMLDNAFQDLQATDLSGDNFFLPNWLQSGYILKSYWDTYPDLGKIDLLVSEEVSEEERLEEEPKFASKMNQGILKSILLTKRDRILLMIVYPELDEN